MPPTPPILFGSTGKAPDFSSGSPSDAQGKFTFNVPKPGRAEGSRDGPALNEPSGVAALVAELRDVKELLKAILVEKRPAQQEHPPSKTGDLLTSPLYLFYNDSEIVDLAKNHCPNDEGMANFREYFLSQFSSSGEWVEEVDRRGQSPEVVFSCKGPKDSVLRVHRADSSQPRPTKKSFFRWPERNADPVRRSLKGDDAKHLIEANWPVSLAQGIKINGKICIRWRVRLEEFKVSWRLLYLYYGSNGVMGCDRFDEFLLHTEMEDRSKWARNLPLSQLSHEVVSPGKIWVLNPCHENTINFDQLSFLSALLLHPWDMSSSLVFSDTLDGGNQYTIASDTLCSFAGPWKPMHLRRRVCLLGKPEPEKKGQELKPSRFSFYRRHEIRCFSNRDPYFMGLKYGDGPTDSHRQGNRHLPHLFPMPSPVNPKGLATSRQSGMFPTLLKGLERRFTEKRLSVVCLASDFNYASAMPSFRIMVINDFPEIPGFTEDSFRNWRTSGLKIEGPAAWQMAYQATIFGLIPIWEREWTSCLDELDNSVRVKIEDITDPDMKDSMMFDASFRRSRFYFEVIQMLRIFSDMIRETERDLQTMISDPYMARYLSWYDDHNEASRENSKRILRANWDLVEAQQSAAARRLLDRIMELSGDMQSLRDGLFNATALLESSRSTAMSRYVFAFTIVTVVFLPPSFIATVFSTQFFNKENVLDTIPVYRDTTIAVALVTYGVSIILIYLADRFGLIRQAWTQVMSGIAAMMPRKRCKSDEPLEKGSILEHGAV